MAVIQVTEDNFDEVVMKSEKPVLLDFYADWCGPCKMVGPVLEELDAENDQLTVVKVNVDNELDLASKYGVQSIPNMIFFKEGKAVTQIIGFANKDAILDKINAGKKVVPEIKEELEKSSKPVTAAIVKKERKYLRISSIFTIFAADLLREWLQLQRNPQ